MFKALKTTFAIKQYTVR